MEAILKTNRQILGLLKEQGALTAKAVADALGLTSMGARQHLQTLTTDSLVKYHDVKAKVGRPARYWHLSAKGHAQFPNHHG